MKRKKSNKQFLTTDLYMKLILIISKLIMKCKKCGKYEIYRDISKCQTSCCECSFFNSQQLCFLCLPWDKSYVNSQCFNCETCQIDKEKLKVIAERYEFAKHDNVFDYPLDMNTSNVEFLVCKRCTCYIGIQYMGRKDTIWLYLITTACREHEKECDNWGTSKYPCPWPKLENHICEPKEKEYLQTCLPMMVPKLQIGECFISDYGLTHCVFLEGQDPLVTRSIHRKYPWLDVRFNNLMKCYGQLAIHR